MCVFSLKNESKNIRLTPLKDLTVSLICKKIYEKKNTIYVLIKRIILLKLIPSSLQNSFSLLEKQAKITSLLIFFTFLSPSSIS
jgi:hypothetical protein